MYVYLIPIAFFDDKFYSLNAPRNLHRKFYRFTRSDRLSVTQLRKDFIYLPRLRLCLDNRMRIK